MNWGTDKNACRNLAEETNSVIEDLVIDGATICIINLRKLEHKDVN